jgi:hypothetical protein
MLSIRQRGGAQVNELTRAPCRYETTVDRVGLALATGGGLGGLAVLLLVIAGGQRDPLQLLTAAALGALFTTLAIAAVGAPVWLALHIAGYRRAWHAGALGGALAMILFVAGQTQGFGLFGLPGDSDTLLFRWLSALATSALLAAVAAGIAVAMWRVAYRPV